MSDTRKPPGSVEDACGRCAEAALFSLQVLDDSMEPEFPQGCVIVIDPTALATDGSYVLADDDGGYLFRQLQRGAEGWSLTALNRRFEAVALPTGLNTVRGVVVQRSGTRRSMHKRYD
ncbi:MAG: S24 family peptidase [Gammaproteobacteria bacterium]|nr:MAG: S24 family peptidase [Gammaproteobacteria bacterium]